MLFGLKNISMTCQWVMIYIFYDMMHNIVKDYVDYLLPKFTTC